MARGKGQDSHRHRDWGQLSRHARLNEQWSRFSIPPLANYEFGNWNMTDRWCTDQNYCLSIRWCFSSRQLEETSSSKWPMESPSSPLLLLYRTHCCKPQSMLTVLPSPKDRTVKSYQWTKIVIVIILIWLLMVVTNGYYMVSIILSFLGVTNGYY